MIQVEVPYGEICPNKNIKVSYDMCKECGSDKSLSKTFVTCHLNNQTLQMTKEAKELLLKDICARLPYGVMVRVEVNDVFIKPTDEVATVNTIKMFDCPQKFRVTPYLRPMTSMIEEERDEYTDIKKGECNGCVLTGKGDPDTEFLLVDWLNSHHFDYRGLIPMGLALEAPEDMYKF